jgi:hypothetical protein
MRTSRPSVVLPIPVRRNLRKPGRDIRDARRRRRIPVQIAAERASISRMTLLKIEKGEPGVAMGSYATVLFVLGLADHLVDLADPRNDPVGLQLEEEHLPKRIRIPPAETDCGRVMDGDILVYEDLRGTKRLASFAGV